MNEQLPSEEPVQSPHVYKQFKLLTNGIDDEIDAMHIIVEAMAGLNGDQVRRVLAYLSQRYARPD